MIRKVLHLTKRFFGVLVSRSLTTTQVAQVEQLLTHSEFVLWQTMPSFDQVHSFQVMQRFLDIYPNATTSQTRGALLHDIGKTKSNLGILSRVIATVAGGVTNRFADYHNHQALGAGMLIEIGSDAATVGLVEGTAGGELAAAQIALLKADNY